MQVKRFLIFIWVMTMIALSGYSQRTVVFSENFDGTTSKLVQGGVGVPTPIWVKDTALYQSSPYSIQTRVPSSPIGARKMLTSDTIDLSQSMLYSNGAGFMRLKFKHICKVSNKDTAIVQYKRITDANWTNIPTNRYQGGGSYPARGFTDGSYSDWQSGSPIATPTSSWWKEETFNLSFEVGFEKFQIRFLLIKGSNDPTSALAGWYIDDVTVIADTVDIIPPTLTWAGTPARPTGTKNEVGPFTVAVNAQTQTTAALNYIKFFWSATHNGVTVHDSVNMTSASGTLYQAVIPAYISGTSVSYHVIVKDAASNEKALLPETYTVTSNANRDTAIAFVGLDMPGTIVSSNDQLVPIKVIVRNSGRDTLQNATFYWQINGGAIQSTTSWNNKALPWGFKDTVTLGTYQPRLNKGDVINIWARQPNGHATAADSLKNQNIMTQADLYVNYQNYPTATVTNNVGPFEIKAEIVSRTQKPITSVTMNVTTATTGGGSGSTTPITMTKQPYSNIWTATVPQTAFGNTITTDITLNDSNGNTVKAIDTFALVSTYSDNNDLKVEAIVSPTTTIPLNYPLPLEVLVRNVGTDPITAFELEWVNPDGTTGQHTYSGASIPSGYSQVVVLDPAYIITTGAGQVTIKVYVKTLAAGDVNQLNDTTQKNFTLCQYYMASTRTVGFGKDFLTMATAITAIKTCGLAGDLTLEIHGTLSEAVDLNNLTPYLNGYTLTLTSPGNNYANGGFTSNNNPVVKLGGTSNLVISGLTIDANSSDPGAEVTAIRFDGNTNCEGVVIRDCHILANLATTKQQDARGISKGGNTGIAKRIYIINNIIEGGWFNIHFYAGTGQSVYGADIRIDSNTMKNAVSKSIVSYYTDYTSIHANTLISRASGGTNREQWNAIEIHYCNGDMTNNRIYQHNTEITGADGFNLDYYNTNNVTPSGKLGLIANNVISIYHEGSTSGFWLNNSRAEIVHNTVYYYADNSTRDGNLVGVNANTSSYIIKNNIFASNNNARLKIGTATSNRWQYIQEIGGNICYGPIHCVEVYTGISGVGNLTASQLGIYQNISGDMTTRFYTAMPNFVNAPTDMRLANSLDVLVAPHPGITTDINGKTRFGQTAAGAFEPDQPSLDAFVVAVPSLYDGIPAGSAPVNVVISNPGSTTINNIELGYSFNGAANVVSGTLTKTILQYGKDTFALQNITVPSSNDEFTLKVWVVNVNGVPDPIKDTLTVKFFSCPTGGFQGTFTVGATGNYTSISRAIDKMKTCGVTGDVTLEILSGTYPEQIDLTNTAALFDTVSLVITSQKYSADSVKFDFDGEGIKLGNSKNITIEYITVGNTTRNKTAILFDGSVENITIKYNKLYAKMGSGGAKVVSKPSGKGAAENISFIGNLISGGEMGIHFWGNGSNENAPYGKNILFDSNRIEKAWVNGVEIQYCDLLFTHNCVYREPTTTQNNGGHIAAFRWNNGDIIGNRMHAVFTAASTGDGFIVNRHHFRYLDPAKPRALIANNEVITHNLTNWSGFRVSGPVDVYHNSLYTNGTGMKGFEIEFDGQYPTVVAFRNNLIALYGSSSNAALDFYQNDVLANNRSNPNSPDCRHWFSYNNYYSSNTANNVRNANSFRTVAQWLIDNPYDVGSISIQPIFINGTSTPTDNLELDESMRSDMSCPALPQVTTDINGKPRIGQTYIGAYAFEPLGRNASLGNLIDWKTETVLNKWTNVSVPIINMGSTAISQAVLVWKVNGITKGTHTWTSTTPLATYGMDTIHLGAFQIDAENTDVTVEIISVNGTADDFSADDMTKAETKVVPIAEFADPLPPSVLTNVFGFDVYVNVNELSGAPLASPLQMNVTKTLNGNYPMYETIAMTQLPDGRWKASISSQYYGVDIEYKVIVTDTCSNSFELVGHTYLQAGSDAKGDVIIGTGTATNGYNAPYLWSRYWGYSLIRQLYHNSEFAVPGSDAYITDIYFQTGGGYADQCNNFSLWLQATTDVDQTHSNWIDPASVAGATCVFGPATKNSATNSWVHFQVNPPFHVPPGENLMVYANNQHNGYTYNYVVWQHSPAPFVSTAARHSDGGWPNLSNTYLGNNRVNTRIVSTFPFLPYNSTDLSLTKFTEPVNAQSMSCGLDSTPMKVVLQNFGPSTYSFPTGNITINFEVTGQIAFSGSKTISTGTLASGKELIVELTSSMPVYRSGSYDLKAWIVNSAAVGDFMPIDDTVAFTYVSNRMGLPIVFDVSSGDIPDFVQESHKNAFNLGSGNPWRVVTKGIVGDDTTNIYEPNGMLSFRGGLGDVAKLMTRQLDLAGAAQPELILSYYHDITAPLGADNLIVQYRTSDAGNEIPLLTISKNNGIDDGWKDYPLDLSSLKNESCVFLSIEAYDNTSQDGAQYIKGFQITGTQNISVTDILVQGLTGCNLSSDVKVILTNRTSQAIDFSSLPTILHFRMDKGSGNTTIVDLPLNSGRLEGMSTDTFIVAPNYVFTSGTYNAIAFIDDNVDFEQSDDTARVTFAVNPLLDVELIPNTSVGNCAWAKAEHQQSATIINRGNIDMEDLVLTLNVENAISGSTETVVENLSGVFPAGDSITYQFTQPYTVPEDGDVYYVNITVAPTCNAALSFSDTIGECIESRDLALLELLTPMAGVTQTYGDTLFVSVKVKNLDPLNDFTNVVVRAVPAGGTALSYTIPSIDANTEVTVDFAQPYTVPSVAQYILKVYLESRDGNPKNDTLSQSYNAEASVSIAEYNVNMPYLFQNVPNPAYSVAKVGYSIPADGEVVFNVYSATGQVLINKTINAVSNGVQSVDFDITGLAAGIYYYSMDYNGQKFVKKMNVQR